MWFVIWCILFLIICAFILPWWGIPAIILLIVLGKSIELMLHDLFSEKPKKKCRRKNSYMKDYTREGKETYQKDYKRVGELGVRVQDEARPRRHFNQFADTNTGCEATPDEDEMDYLRELREERDAYDDFIASMDMDND